MLFRVLSNKVFFKVPVIGFSLCSSVTGSFLWSSVIGSSIGSTVLFFGMPLILSRKTYWYIFLKSKTDVLFCIIFSKRRSHLSVSLACFNTYKKTDSEKYEEMCDSNTKCYVENIGHQFSDLQIVYIAEYIIVIQ